MTMSAKIIRAALTIGIVASGATWITVAGATNAGLFFALLTIGLLCLSV
jgi:hypothetical protein